MSRGNTVRTVKLEGECRHGLSLVACDECREAQLRKIRRANAAPAFAELAEGRAHDLDLLVREAIPYVAAKAVIVDDDRGFWLRDVVDQVFTVRRHRELTRAMFGAQTPMFMGMAEKHVTERVRYCLRIRDAQTSVRIYVCWRVAGSQPRRWGALHHLGVDQLELVARDYGILGQGVQYSKDATVFLIELLRRENATAVRQIWDQAVPALEEWKRSA
jgi:hypothetical protein